MNPAVPSHDGMVPSGPSDAKSLNYSQTHSHTHSPAHTLKDFKNAKKNENYIFCTQYIL